MEDWISGTLAVLGTLMVLAGATLIVLRTLGITSGWSTPEPAPEPAPGESPAAAGRQSWRPLNPATQLIVWGVVLLVVAALTVGLISFGISLEAGTQ